MYAIPILIATEGKIVMDTFFCFSPFVFSSLSYESWK